VADFATVAELETFMGTSALGARGTAMLGYASAAIRRYTHQDLEVTTGRQETYAGDAWRDALMVTQKPVTAVTAITINAVAFTDFTWSRWGKIDKNDGSPWDTGPILVTYDSGYASTSDEYLGIKAIALEVAARAMGGNPETFGMEVLEVRGPTPAIFLTDEEKMMLHEFMGVTVG
jgi:hypothetical protein